MTDSHSPVVPGDQEKELDSIASHDPSRSGPISEELVKSSASQEFCENGSALQEAPANETKSKLSSPQDQVDGYAAQNAAINKEPVSDLPPG